MSDKLPDGKDGLLELLKKLWLPVAGFIGAVTLAYNFYQLWLENRTTVTYFLAGGGLLILIVALARVVFRRKTITRRSEEPFGRTRTEHIPTYPLRYRRIAQSALAIIFIGMALGGYFLFQRRQATQQARQEMEKKLIVAIAVFEGPEEVYGLRNEIIESLNSAFSKDGEIEIVTVNEVITPDMGSMYARALGEQLIADLVIWGWYRPTEDPNITIHIENLSPTQIDALRESETYEPQATLAQLESFKIQRQLGSETSTMISYLIGMLEYKSRDYQGATERFEQVLTQNDISTFVSRFDLLFNLGNSNSGLGNYERAIEHYEKALEIDPEYGDAYNNRGIAYYYLEQYERAIEDFNKALDIDPEDAIAYYNRGVVYANLGQYERGIEDFDKALDIDPENAIAYYNRGIAYANLEQYERAIEDFNKALEINPEYATAYNNRGVAYANLGQYEHAIEDYEKALEINPEYATAYINRGVAYANLGQYERAIEEFDKALEIDPEDADAYHYRGVIYQQLGRTTEAEADFKKYEELTGQRP